MNRAHNNYSAVHHLQVLELLGLLPADECMRSWNGSSTHTRVPADAICAPESFLNNTCKVGCFIGPAPLAYPLLLI